MHAHNPSAASVRHELKTVRIGLGLARLLVDAGRIEEAQTLMVSLGGTSPSIGPSHASAERPSRAKASWAVQKSAPGRRRGPRVAAMA